MKQRTKATATVGIIYLFLMWLGGYNFDTRGEVEVYFAIAGLVIMFFTFSYPGYGDEH